MGFLTPALLGGVALVAVPIALHLIMRRQAKELTFPALRFVQQRRSANRRRMRLRHWLLLALRCLLIAAMSAALARPTLKGSGLKGKEGAPLAISLVLDNSLRMQYVHQNRSRLQQATERALELVEKLPEDAKVAVCDLGRAANGFAPDLSAAQSRLRNLRTAADARPLAHVVEEAVRLAAEHEQRRQEVFVFTDMAASAWSEEALQGIAQALAESPDVRIYVVDCGVQAPKNSSLGELELRRSVLRVGETLHLEAVVASNLQDNAPLVELMLQDEDGRLQKRDQRIAGLDDRGTARVAFDVADLSLGVHQGALQLATTDPLSVDNTRYFTVEVRPPARILLAAARPDDAVFVQTALSAAPGGESAQYQCEVKTFEALGDAPLDDYQAVMLLDPVALADDVWTRLRDYAAGGGGVGIFLGHNAAGQLDAFNADAPQRLLPGPLKRISRDSTYLRPRRLDHPALAGLRRYAEDIPWQACEVFQYWTLGENEKASESYVVASYANDDAAIIERRSARGRVLVATTPFSDPLIVEGRQPWNTLPAAPWPFLAICDNLVGYLAQDADTRLDYRAGETARIRLASAQQISSYVVRMPDGQADTRVATGDEELAVSTTDVLGNYRLTAGGRAQRLDRGFSVNVPAELSDLSRLSSETLAAALPKQRVRLSDDLEEVEKYVHIGRSGRELYPWMIGLVTLIWTAEHVLANRFYRNAMRE
ncbi:MAG: BatA and WFA domain-containing protein [Pirellulales bacterium]|nr:BatA and WFA domain-containing protein [Pirellulales bacterium]